MDPSEKKGLCRLRLILEAAHLYRQVGSHVKAKSIANFLVANIALTPHAPMVFFLFGLESNTTPLDK